MNVTAWTSFLLSVALDHGAVMPTRGHAEDAGLDLYPMAGETPYLPAGAIKVFPTGVRVAIPPGFVGRIEGRSGMASRGVVPLGGLIDSGFTGPISIILANLSMTRWAAEPGTPIGQLVIFPILLPSGLDLRDSLDATERGEGGFGHTDLRS